MRVRTSRTWWAEGAHPFRPTDGRSAPTWGSTVLDRIRTKSASDQGFTLVEMLIVIVVLGVLAGITVFGIATFREDAEASACSSSVKVVSTAVDAYRAKTGDIPTLAQLESGGYLKDAPNAAYGLAINATSGVVTGTC